MATKRTRKPKATPVPEPTPEAPAPVAPTIPDSPILPSSTYQDPMIVDLETLIALMTKYGFTIEPKIYAKLADAKSKL